MKFKIYCINLYERSDRYSHMKKQFNKFNIDVKFIRNYKHKLGGRYGCFISHIQCLKDALESNLDCCLVFEDDVNISLSCNEIIDSCLKILKKNKLIDIINASSRDTFYLTNKYKGYFYEGIKLGTDCIFLNKNFIFRILNTYIKYIDTYHYDRFLLVIVNKYIACTKYITSPAAFGSDNPWANSNDNLITLGYLNFIQYLTNYTTVHFIFQNQINVLFYKFLIKYKLDKIKHLIISKIIKNFKDNKIYRNLIRK